MPADPARVKSLFLAASDLADPVERAAYLDRKSGGDPDLRARVEALLRANDAAPPPGSGLADATRTFDPDAPPDAPTAPYPGRVEQAGTVVVGRYTLVEVIGEGGMGTVWRARQSEPVKRFVAVKLIKAGMDSRQVLARFEGERQALALMDHPHIAKVLDGGLHDGRPYFVMELVKGIPITDFCDQRKLTPRQRLELFVPVCQALQHAHQKGVIHRDVKPSNVLVALYDDRPVPKVIDFGIAKAAGGVLTERTIDTGFGGVLGTPQYMSPEQATFNNLDVDTRSDVYALGVLLYDLLTGSPPFARKELERKGLLEILRVVREEEPPRPSTKLSTADALPTLSANRGMEPKQLTGLLRNELDWIVMKALEKDRARRYETANGLAADVQRHLAGEPVQAVPPSAGYRLRKFAGKNRTAVSVALLVVVAAVVSAAGIVYGVEKAGHERVSDALRGQAERERDAAEAARRGEGAARAEAERQRERAAAFEYGRSVQLAYEEWRDARLAEARAILADADPRFRGWEWHFLHRLCHADRLTLDVGKMDPSLIGHDPEVSSAAFSPDGASIVTGCWDGTVAVWDAKTGARKATLREKLGRVTSAAFAPDGTKILAVGNDSKALLVDARTGTDLVAVPVASAGGWFRPSAMMSGDGSRIVASESGGAAVWDAKTGARLLTLQGPETAVAYSRDGSRIVTGGGLSTRAAVWDAKTGARLQTLHGHKGYQIGVAISPDGKCAATTGRDETVRLWNADTGAELFTLKGHTGWVNCAAFSPDGARVATGGVDRLIKVWDVKTGDELATFRGHAGPVNSLAFGPDGARLVSGGGEGTARVWDLRDRDYAVSVRENLVRAAAFGPDGTRFVTAGESNVATVYDAATGAEIRSLRGHGSWLYAVAYSPDGSRIATGSIDKTAKIWDAKTGREIRALSDHRGLLQSVSFSPDGARVLTGGVDTRVWDANTGTQLLVLPEGTGDQASFGPDGSRIVTGSSDGTAKVWDAKTGSLLLTLRGHTREVVAASFSPDGSRVVTGSDDGTARVWDAKTRIELSTLKGHSKRVVSASFSPDGLRIVTGSWDTTVRLWDAMTGAALLTMKGHGDILSAAEFSRDGSRLLTATGSLRGGAKVWDSRPVNRAFVREPDGPRNSSREAQR